MERQEHLQAHAIISNAKWEARTAAGQLLGALAAHCICPGSADVAAASMGSLGHSTQQDIGASCRALADINMAEILREHNPLLASSGEVSVDVLLCTTNGQRPPLQDGCVLL